jgi:hypothetical protein
VVFHGSEPVIISRRRGRVITVRSVPSRDRFDEYLAMFREMINRDFKPLKKVVVEEINGEQAGDSEHADAFREFGFRDSYKGLVLEKKYWS